MYEKTAIDEGLEFDPIAEAERITGRSYKEDASVTALGVLIGMQHREKVDAELFLNRDTNSYQQTCDEFCATVEDVGFQKVLEDPFTDPHSGRPELLRIYWMPGFLAFFTSFHGRANDAKIYFDFVPNEDGEFNHRALNQCSHGGTKSFRDGGAPRFECSYDFRQGLRNKIEQLRKCGTIPEKWEDVPFLWLCDYAQTEEEGYDYKAIANERISRLPEHVREMIGGACE